MVSNGFLFSRPKLLQMRMYSTERSPNARMDLKCHVVQLQPRLRVLRGLVHRIQWNWRGEKPTTGQSGASILSSNRDDQATLRGRSFDVNCLVSLLFPVLRMLSLQPCKNCVVTSSLCVPSKQYRVSLDGTFRLSLRQQQTHESTIAS